MFAVVGRPVLLSRLPKPPIAIHGGADLPRARNNTVGTYTGLTNLCRAMSRTVYELEVLLLKESQEVLAADSI